MSLYTIREEIRYIMDNACWYDPDTGEIVDQGVVNRLAELHDEEDTKLENIACYIKNLLAEAGDMREEEKALAARRQAKERKAEWLKQYLVGYLAETGRARFESPRAALSVRKSNKVEVKDVEALAAYAKYQPGIMRQPEPEINRELIGKLLREGEDVPGAELVETNNLQIK